MAIIADAPVRQEGAKVADFAFREKDRVSWLLLAGDPDDLVQPITNNLSGMLNCFSIEHWRQDQIENL